MKKVFHATVLSVFLLAPAYTMSANQPAIQQPIKKIKVKDQYSDLRHASTNMTEKQAQSETEAGSIQAIRKIFWCLIACGPSQTK